MLRNRRVKSGYALLVAVVALPCVLLFTSLRTMHELDEQKQVYLRERVAEIVARLETESSDREAMLTLLEAEPNLRDLQVIERASAAGEQADLQPIWDGQQLYRTEMIGSGDARIYRAYVPFHSPDGLRIAQIDLEGNAADFLLRPARHNVIVSVLGGLVLIALAVYAVWMARRSAVLQGRQAELEHLARIGRLAAVLAHEIRNPLGTIKGFTQLANERADAATVELLAPVLAETQRLERLVGDLLMYGRPPQPRKCLVSWPEVARELNQQALALAGERALRVTIAQDPIRFETDPDMLRQILLNVLRNAVDAVADEASATVEIALQLDLEQITITTSDNGPGLPEEVISRVFEPFVTTKAFGTGLGLAISDQLAKSIGATLELRNRQPRGVEVVLTLHDANAFREKPVIAEYGTDSCN
jgi:signal transduction histidine kinase